MKALRFSRDVPRYAAARVTSGLSAGSGARSGPLELVDIDPPQPPAADWLELRPRLAGICGSDLATIDGHASGYFEPIVSFPFTPGHEVVGDLADDRRAVLVPILDCTVRGIEPKCPSCTAGRTNHCERIAFGHLAPGLQTGYCSETGGGWSTRLVAHPSQLIDVPDSLSDEGAVLVEPMACSVHAAHVVAALEPARIAVIGTGTLGIGLIAALARLEAAPEGVLATAKYPVQQAFARELGADRVVAPSELTRAVRSASGSFVLGARQLTGGFDVVADCVGSAASIEQALSIVAPGGTIVMVGMPGHVEVDLTSLWHRETVLRGCYGYTRADFAEAIELVSDAGLERLVSATYPLRRYRDAIRHAATT
ncbi:MAG: zinc-binding dehydrogenase, partial [Actinobacteria bacterium]|nr:zinc-binding dehydrogenase [Actinomycetota bacterium]